MELMDAYLLFLMLASLGSGMIAGLFCSFSGFMMKALASLPKPSGISAMQAINRFIVRPSFLLVFMGTGIACLLATVLGWQELGVMARNWTLAGTIFYIVGSIGVTIFFNVPLNDRLEAVSADSEEGARLWQEYLSHWTQWNHLRSVASLLSTACLIIALYLSL